ncbi:hypothetical protein FUAX_17480 [Fulvitalea axinellae]|uniref:FecR family protein n=1 Tax=Fulvitalea axinellae TaxID=1182444 RepID=A0AAU9CK54_9BACT|nr:hypothetical protein FUAX_17480 [Fulvitalea axinellae]
MTGKIQEATVKYLKGELDAEARADLDRWLAEDEANRRAFDETVEMWRAFGDSESVTVEIPEPVWMKPETKVVPMRNKSRWWAVAATLLLAGVFSYVLFFRGGSSDVDYMAHSEVTITYRGDRDLEVKTIDALQEEKGIDYHKGKNEINIDKPFFDNREITVNVPMGKRISLRLSDGTKVNLNSMSTLVFPSQFKTKRKVRLLTGEGFFSVAKSEKPFIVRMKGLNVRVLGTEFNVSNYKGEDRSVTLEEGSVALYQKDEKKRATLKPGQQALIRADNPSRMMIRDVETGLYSCWKDNVLRFEDTSFGVLEARLERWYDVEIENSNERLGNDRFTGLFDGRDNIETILKLLAFRDNIRYEIEGRKIRVW